MSCHRLSPLLPLPRNSLLRCTDGKSERSIISDRKMRDGKKRWEIVEDEKHSEWTFPSHSHAPTACSGALMENLRGDYSRCKPLIWTKVKDGNKWKRRNIVSGLSPPTPTHQQPALVFACCVCLFLCLYICGWKNGR